MNLNVNNNNWGNGVEGVKHLGMPTEAISVKNLKGKEVLFSPEANVAPADAHRTNAAQARLLAAAPEQANNITGPNRQSLVNLAQAVFSLGPTMDIVGTKGSQAERRLLRDAIHSVLVPEQPLAA